jgi:hypothetical protein
VAAGPEIFDPACFCPMLHTRRGACLKSPVDPHDPKRIGL